MKKKKKEKSNWLSYDELKRKNFNNDVSVWCVGKDLNRDFITTINDIKEVELQHPDYWEGWNFMVVNEREKEIPDEISDDVTEEQSEQEIYVPKYDPTPEFKYVTSDLKREVKYLVEKHDDCSSEVNSRVYFDDIDEMIDYLQENKETLFNNGFKRNEIRLIEIKKYENKNLIC